MGIYNSKTFDEILENEPHKLVKYIKSLNSVYSHDRREIIFKCLVSKNCDIPLFEIINSYLELSVYDNYLPLPININFNIKFDNLEDYKNYFNKFDKLICLRDGTITEYFKDGNTNLNKISLLLHAAFTNSDSENLLFYINYFWFMFRYTDYDEVLKNTLSNSQINQLQEHSELLIRCILHSINISKSEYINTDDVYTISNVLKMVKVLCLKKDNFILLLIKIFESNSSKAIYEIDLLGRKLTIIKLVIKISKLYKSKYSQIYMSDEFNDFIVNFINSLKYEDLIKNQKDLIEIIPNHDIWHAILEKHINYSNMESIINYLSNSNNFNFIDIILNSEWDEKSLQKLEKILIDNLQDKLIFENLLKILKIGILKKYFNLIKDIIKRFMKNNNYDSFSEIYPILNEQYNTNIINIFVKHDYSFIPKKHLSKKNYKKWNKSGKNKINNKNNDSDSDSDSDSSESESKIDENEIEKEGTIANTGI